MIEKANRDEEPDSVMTEPIAESITESNHRLQRSVDNETAAVIESEKGASTGLPGKGVSTAPNRKEWSTSGLIRFAILLSVITIVYNVIEGVASIILGGKDETLALMGFGIDSFVEVLSAIGVLHMTLRMRADGHAEESRQRFERRALRITGISFYVLVGGILAASILQVVRQIPPESTFWGMVVTGISMLGMGLLIKGKSTVGHRLNSPAILADANCSKSCLYLSAAVFASGLLYEWTGLLYADTLGALAVAFFALKEGREAMQKSRSDDICGCHGCQA